MDRTSRTSWLFLLDWGVVALTMVAAGASALAALIAFKQDDTSAMAEAVLACGASIAAAWLGRQASQAARRWHDELVAWHGNDIVLLTDEAGRILDANDRAIDAYGVALEVLCRRDVRELRHGTARDGVEAHLEELRAKGRAIFETVHRRPDGAPFPVEVSARVVEVRGRRLLHLIARDVTEAHRSRARLVAAERLAAVGSVAAGMAHDVNNPLCSVLGNLSFAADELGGARPDLDEVGRALADAESAAQRVRDLVRELSAFAVGFGTVSGESDLREVVEQAVEASRDQIGRRARLIVDIPDLPHVQGPAPRLSQVFTSILRRAADATPAGEPERREIRIVARRADLRRLSVEVVDDGPPLPPGEIVGPFESAQGQPRSTRGGGAGLAVVVGMVRAVGGDVVAESAPGHGTVVRVLLPVAGSIAH